jgi:hypothetical protein
MTDLTVTLILKELTKEQADKIYEASLDIVGAPISAEMYVEVFRVLEDETKWINVRCEENSGCLFHSHHVHGLGCSKSCKICKGGTKFV